MQQMNQIIFGKSSKTASNSTIKMSKTDDSQSFAEALSNASEKKSLTKIHQIYSDKNEKSSEIKSHETKSADKKEKKDDTTDDGAEMIFAQLSMSENLKRENNEGGKILPSDDATGDESQISATSDDDTNLFVETLPLATQQQTPEQLIDKLNNTQLQDLMGFSGQSKAQLQAMNKADLNQLISDYNMQAPVVDESILSMAEADMEGINPLAATQGSSSANKLDAQQAAKIDALLNQMPADNKLTASSTKTSSDKAVMDMLNQLLPAQDAKADKDKLAGVKIDENIAAQMSLKVSQRKPEGDVVSLSAAAVNSASKNVAEGNILGEKATTTNAAKTGGDTAIEGVIKSVTNNGPDKALNTVNAAIANAPTMTASNATAQAHLDNISLDDADTTSTIDGVKSLQNQSSFTPVHKSDVPQFQLSLRANAEGGNQMQEMIQRFSPLMKQQLMTMVSNGVHHAEIRLDPAELGSMMVKIQVQGDQTQVQFHAAHQQTRDVLEQAIPRLRDMLAQEGMNLTDSQVSQQGSEQQQERSSGQPMEQHANLDEIAAQEPQAVRNTAASSHSGIDYYA
ncbi:flagellar hook-length control protein FliK [Shewanella intestini]|uniref:Flagellar hook-length control protein-like C-terminal domain-containing protein n=1 Tax=Shewanella intestini TaxID=2017544 RepID=A0ABS5HZX8_9GAMM|nr:MULTISPECIES: flagellar hook-length control protein FliK [Shewanella]MBR9727331.1 hypothetical protein [Shewanella intestini]MRG35619.1 hypothetical protein [Shewanella sp. XMDDZSB0408]